MVRQVSSRSFLSKQRLKPQKQTDQIEGFKMPDKEKRTSSKKSSREKSKSLRVVLFWCVFLIDNMFWGCLFPFGVVCFQFPLSQWFYFKGGCVDCCVCYTSLWAKPSSVGLACYPRSRQCPVFCLHHRWHMDGHRWESRFGVSRPIWRDSFRGDGNKNTVIWGIAASTNANSKRFKVNLKCSFMALSTLNLNVEIWICWKRLSFQQDLGTLLSWIWWLIPHFQWWCQPCHLCTLSLRAEPQEVFDKVKNHHSMEKQLSFPRKTSVFGCTSNDSNIYG